MTTDNPTNQTKRYEEHLRAPHWVFGLLGLMLGAAAGILTAVAIRSLSDNPWLSGAEAILFFLTFAIAIAIITYVMLNSTIMSIVADHKGLRVSLGILGLAREWSWQDIQSVATAEYSVTQHGGRGNIFGPASRRAWTMFGIKTGVEIKTADSDHTYFISSRKSREMADALQISAQSNIEQTEQTD